FGHKKSFLSQNFSAESILTRKTATSIRFSSALQSLYAILAFPRNKQGLAGLEGNTASCQGVSG
ncbi:hypothetical protein, partial [Escherichia coli]|uniref:hypothetical protein n=1 Tax=Escherichia coli TaxID=562 RepID=UPI0021D38545